MSGRGWNTQARPAPDIVATHIPFTAPFLAGVCGRVHDRSLDFILPNPSGGRGAYVVNWRMAAEYASPTLHDIMLARRLRELPALDPVSVREAARAVAIEGYAGRRAADAAERARSRMEAETLRLWSRTLLELIRASDIPPEHHAFILARLDNAGPNVMTDGLARLATRLGWRIPALLSDALTRLSVAYAPLCPQGRVPALLSRFELLQTGLSEELTNWIVTNDQAPVSLQRTIAKVQRCLRRSSLLAAQVTRHSARPDALAAVWRTDPVACLAPIQALERILDGWDRICLLWRDCDSLSSRLAVLPDIALLVGLADARTVTDEPAETRTGEETSAAPQGVLARPEIAGEAPMPMLIERYERIRARELELEHGDG